MSCFLLGRRFSFFSMQRNRVWPEELVAIPKIIQGNVDTASVNLKGLVI